MCTSLKFDHYIHVVSTSTIQDMLKKEHLCQVVKTKESLTSSLDSSIIQAELAHNFFMTLIGIFLSFS